MDITMGINLNKTKMIRMLTLLLAGVLTLMPALSLAEYDYASIKTPRVIVMDAADGTVFYEKAADERAFPASTTKIMTCILALENGNLDAPVTVGEEVLGTSFKFTKYSSLMGLVPGEQVTLRDLVYGLMMVSGNDAAEAIAVHIAGSIGSFASMMNQKAASLGMSNTHFANPHGVQDENHYTTARDLAKLTMYALKNPQFVEICKTTSYTAPASNLRAQPLVLDNTNRLIKMPATDPYSCVYENAIGVKTGDTNAAGKCLVAAAEKDGARIIAVFLGDTTEMYGGDKDIANLARFVNAKGIFEDLFANTYRSMSGTELNLPTTFSLEVAQADPADLTDGALPVSVDVSGLNIYGTQAQLDSYKAQAGQITTLLNPVANPIQAPIAQGTFLGTVDYMLNGAVIHSASLIADREVAFLAQMQTEQPPQEEKDPVSAVGDEPLVKKNPIQLGFLGWLFIILILLLIALIVIFICTEKKRQRERAARRRAHQGDPRRRSSSRRR